MTNPSKNTSSEKSGLPLPLKILFWPFVFVWRVLYNNWISYLIGGVVRDENRIYSVRFIWYGDSVYMHPMIWGSVVLFFVTKADIIGPGWPILVWFVMLCVCFLTVIYNFDIIKASILLVSVAAIFGLAYVSNSEWHWNPVSWIKGYVTGLEVTVSPGFYIASAWVFALLISSELIWAWLFNRVELDESYVYERRFMQGAAREPIFARGLKRETKDLLELIIMGAGDITHRTKNGVKRFKNVPGASLGLGRAIDHMLDHRRPGQIKMEHARDDLDEQVMPSDAHPDLIDGDDGIHDDYGGDDVDDAGH